MTVRILTLTLAFLVPLVTGIALGKRMVTNDTYVRVIKHCPGHDGPVDNTGRTSIVVEVPGLGWVELRGPARFATLELFGQPVTAEQDVTFRQDMPIPRLPQE
jgi:hypothetical protein